MRRRQLENQERTRAKTLAAKKHYCKPCKKPLQSKGALSIHESRSSHIEKVTGVKPQKSGPSARQIKANAVRAAKTHYCPICDYSADLPSTLATHLTGTPHIEKAKAAASSASS